MSKIVYTIFNPKNQQIGLPNSLGFLDASSQKSFTVEEDSIEESSLGTVIASGVVTLVSAVPAASSYGPANLTIAQTTAVLSGGRAVSPYCVFCVPTIQAVGTGAARDVSGNGRDFALGALMVDDVSGVWSDTSREFNSLAKIPDSASTSGGYLYMPSLTTVWDMSEWFIFSTIMQPTVAPQARNLISCGKPGTNPGWYLKTDATGKLYVVTVNSALVAGGNIASTPTLTTSGLRTHITVAVDPINHDIFLYVNGILANQWLNSWSGTGASSRFLATAHEGVTSSSMNQSVYGALYGGMHYYKGVGALPSTHAAIARRLFTNPFTPLGYFDI